MISSKQTYECTCFKCGHKWSTKTFALPKACPKCHRITWNDDHPQGFEYFLGEKSDPDPNIRVESAILTLKDLSTSHRLEVFSEFELCCGMNLGECICVPEEIEVQIAPVDDKLARARAIMASFEENPVKTPEKEVEEVWIFTKDNPWYSDDGNVYRKQALSPLWKRFRTVQVDEDDLEKILGS